MNYVVCQIGSRQYLVNHGQVLKVDKLPDNTKNLSIDQVLLAVDGDKVELGSPYLKKNLNFEVMENIKERKIQVATYKAKANYRRVLGQRRVMSKIKLAE